MKSPYAEFCSAVRQFPIDDDQAQNIDLNLMIAEGTRRINELQKAVDTAFDELIRKNGSPVRAAQALSEHAVAIFGCDQ